MFSLKESKLAHLKSLEAFAAVMDTGSITKAAEYLGVTQPSISQHIQRLENTFEIELFMRQNGRVFPTERAKILHEDVEELLTGIDKTFTKWRRGQTRQVNQLRICASFSNSSLVLPHLLTRLPRQASMHFQVTSASQEESVAALIENRADVAFHTKPLDHKSIENRRFLSARQVCVLPKAHPLADKTQLTVADLQNQKMISVPKSDPCYLEHQEIVQRHNLQIQNLLETPYSTLAMQMAEEFNALYIGNVLIAELFCQKNPGLVWREIDEFEQKTHFYFAVSPWLQNSNTETELKRAIDDAFAELSHQLGLW
ncbi:LysR substrate-binding domain-containing protein [Kiloniella sp.]|uniref:LysR substrate-binding domain-containing protein n=1 Tax=Kiloniella sp. TaxID=1938587 RepID=UPI003B0146E9